MSGFVVWFTGLSGSGKSTLAAMLSAELRRRGVHVEVLDGDEVRTHLSKGLGFSREDRDTNVRRIGWVAKVVARSGACAMTAAISPYRSIRDEQRAANAHFVEIYCRCSIPVLAERDPKGLYKKALAGEIKHFTGVDDPYEEPEHPEVVVDTGVEPKEESLARILAKLEALDYIPAGAGSKAAGAARSRLVSPHGGELVNRFVVGAEREALAALARTLPAIDLDARAEADVELIATGALSPLKGFMTSKDYLRVVNDMRLENGLPWPIPITLSISDDTADALPVGSRAALRSRDGRLVAILDVADAWECVRDLLVGGEIHVLDRPAAPLFPLHHKDPRETRAIFAERGWARVVAFHTDRPMHRAEEHVTKSALEICDGLLIHPGIGEASPGDVPADVRMRCYEALLDGYYDRSRVLLSTFPRAKRGPGPREVLFNAIVRKNYGASHFIVGKGDVGEGDMRAIREAFDAFAPGEIGVEPLFFEEAFWSNAAGAMATAKTAPEEARPSEESVHEILSRGELPPAHATRPEVARILLDSMRERG